MALTEYDKKKLSASDQKKIQQATDNWNAAYAKGDKAGMEAAQKEAAAIRSNAGYTTNSDGTYKSSTGSSSKNSQYTGYTIGSDAGKKAAQDLAIGDTFYASDGSMWTKGNDGYITVTKNGQTYNNVYKQSDLGTLGTQQVNAGVPSEYVEATLYDRLNKISNNPELAKYLNDGTFQMMYNYIQEQKDAETKAEYEALLNEYNQDRPDEYSNPYKSEIDELLNQILNRDSFSYDAMNDPLYQQYAEMYRREGDRAMKNTITEAAAGAGGMNTYAVTAAQQANSYYNSLLNDKVPELAQLAYQMYLNDIDLKVQDLGLLQNMDATQYARYRDTMTDWYNDRNFAYGTYQDAVQQSNWQANYDSNEYWNNTNYINDNYWNNKNFDFNDYWKDKEFDNNNYWANKEFDNNNYWAEKEWDAQQEDKEYERGQSEQEKAYNQCMELLSKGAKPSAEMLNEAGITYEQAFAIMGAYGYGPLANTSTSKKTSSASTGTKRKTVEDDGLGYVPGESTPGEKSDEAKIASGLIDLGLGLVYDTNLINELAKAGGIYEKDGKLKWSDGWNKDNYRERLQIKPFPYLMSPLNYEVYK